MLKLNEIIGYLPYGLKFYDLLDKEVISVYSLYPPKDTFDSPTFWMKYPREADEPIFHRRVLDWRAYKPLLLPPSEMSDEQVTDLCEILEVEDSRDFLMQFMTLNILWAVEFKDMNKFYDYCHANMIDYRDLIGRGDALDLREYEFTRKK